MVAVEVAVVVTTAVMIVVEEGIEGTVVFSKAVATLVTRMVEVGCDMNEVEGGEKEDTLKNRRETTVKSCEEIVSVIFEVKVEATERGGVKGTVL